VSSWQIRKDFRRSSRSLPQGSAPGVGDNTFNTLYRRTNEICRCLLSLNTRTDTTLLHHMRQFMRQQTSPFGRFRRILTCTKSDVPPNSKSFCVYRSCSVSSTCIGMYPHLTEIGAKPRLEKCSRCLRQRLAASSQGLDVRRGRWLDERRACSMYPSLNLRGWPSPDFLLAVGTQSLHFGSRHCRRDDRYLLHVRSRHAHHGIRHAIGFLLVRVCRLADRELRLDRRGTSLCTAL